VFGVLWALARNRDRVGGGKRYAIDPVCGMQVEIAQAPEQARDGTGVVYFCSGHCRDRFVANPERFSHA
jgi:YHS domain-containing protein